MIREIFGRKYAEKSTMEKAIAQNLDSAISGAIWSLFDDIEIREHLRSLIKAEIESESFKELIKQAVHQSVWSSSIKINPDGQMES